MVDVEDSEAPLLAEHVSTSSAPTRKVQDPKRGKSLWSKASAAQRRLLMLSYTILVSLWILMTLMASFFPLSPAGAAIDPMMTGIIFAAFPFGTAISSPFVARLMQANGTRSTLCLGCFLMAVFICMFGAVPFGVSSASRQWFFLVIGLLYGASSALAESGVYAVLAASFPMSSSTQTQGLDADPDAGLHADGGASSGSLGEILATTEIAAGAGAALGPFLGGLLFDGVGSAGASWRIQFFVPFAACALLPAGCFFACRAAMPCAENGAGSAGEAATTHDNKDDTTSASGECDAIARKTDEEYACKPTGPVTLTRRPPTPSRRGVPSPVPSPTHSCSPVSMLVPSDCGVVGGEGEHGTGGGGGGGGKPPVLRMLVPLVVTVLSAACAGVLGPTLEVRTASPPLSWSPSGTGSLFLGMSAAYMAASVPLGRFIDRTKPGGAGRCLVPPLLALMLGGLGILAVSFAMLGPMYVQGIVDLRAVFDGAPPVIVAALLQGIGWCCTVIPTLPMMLESVPPGHTLAQSTTTGYWVAAYAAGSAVGPLLGSSMLRLRSAVLCNVDAGTAGCFDGCCTITCFFLLTAAILLCIFWLSRHRSHGTTA